MNERKRSVALPKFGAQLRRLRGDQTRGDICRALETYGLKVDRSTLLQYERGTVKAPDPAILWALGRIYQQASIDDLLTIIAIERTGRTLRQGVELARPTLSAQQVKVAEWFGAFDPEIQRVLLVLMEALTKGDAQRSAAVAARRRTRHRLIS